MLGQIKEYFSLFDFELINSLHLIFIQAYLEFTVPIYLVTFFLKSDIDVIEQVKKRTKKLMRARLESRYSQSCKLIPT
jgi:hypothetical protein